MYITCENKQECRIDVPMLEEWAFHIQSHLGEYSENVAWEFAKRCLNTSSLEWIRAIYDKAHIIEEALEGDRIWDLLTQFNSEYVGRKSESDWRLFLFMCSIVFPSKTLYLIMMKTSPKIIDEFGNKTLMILAFASRQIGVVRSFCKRVNDIFSRELKLRDIMQVRTVEQLENVLHNTTIRKEAKHTDLVYAVNNLPEPVLEKIFTEGVITTNLVDNMAKDIHRFADSASLDAVEWWVVSKGYVDISESKVLSHLLATVSLMFDNFINEFLTMTTLGIIGETTIMDIYNTTSRLLTTIACLIITSKSIENIQANSLINLSIMSLPSMISDMLIKDVSYITGQEMIKLVQKHFRPFPYIIKKYNKFMNRIKNKESGEKIKCRKEEDSDDLSLKQKIEKHFR